MGLAEQLENFDKIIQEEPAIAHQKLASAFWAHFQDPATYGAVEMAQFLEIKAEYITGFTNKVSQFDSWTEQQQRDFITSLQMYGTLLAIGDVSLSKYKSLMGF